jgi:hypothetical protein
MLKFSIYIVSKGRWESRLTANALDKMGVPYRVVIEPQEHDQYAAVIDPAKLLILPFSNLGQGSIPARNWIWEHSITNGDGRHWILDDNIAWFAYLNRNKKTRCHCDVPFRAVEDFTERYQNIAISGIQYEMFTPALSKTNEVIFNTRIYSCILIKNDIPFRWRGRYNEDTDLSLRVLKAGYCTALIQVFICKKVTTLTMKGGNTDELYRQDNEFDGRLNMAKSLLNQHPDVVKITRKWGRFQHCVNYQPFKENKLIRRTNIDWDSIRGTVNDYGMKLKKING